MKKEEIALSEKPGKYAKTPAEHVFLSNSLSSTDKNHWKIAFLVVSVLFIVTIITLNSMFPLKPSIYRLEVDKLGNQQVVKMSAQEFVPNENEIRARLKELTERMFAIEPRLLNKELLKVESMMSGQARKQFSEFLTEEKPFLRIKEHPDLLREVTVETVNLIAGKVYLIDFTTKERIGVTPPIFKRRTMTVNYEIIPPSNDEEVFNGNPSGIFIVSFTISDKISNYAK